MDFFSLQANYQALLLRLFRFYYAICMWWTLMLVEINGFDDVVKARKGCWDSFLEFLMGVKNSSSLIFLPHLMRPHIYDNQFRFDLMERREKNFRFTENKLFFSSLRKRLYIIKLSTVFNWEQESKKVRRKWHLSTFLLSLRNFLFAQISLRIWFMAMPIKRWESFCFIKWN